MPTNLTNVEDFVLWVTKMGASHVMWVISIIETDSKSIEFSWILQLLGFNIVISLINAEWFIC
jgi:hypothetical protein